MLFRFNKNSDSGGSLSCIHTEPLSDHWITHLSWSPWVTRAVGHCESLLAFSTDNGIVGLVKVTQKLQSNSNAGFVSEYTTCVVFDVQGPICEADKRGVTALTWVQPPRRNPILVYTKPGLVILWSLPGSEPTWYGTRILPFQTQKVSVGSSAISPVSGVSYVLHRDALILSLFDGSLHAIHNMTVEPTWTPPLAGDILTSAELSRASRALFAQVTPAGISYLDVNRIGGMASYDSQSTLIWIYEALRPADFSYKHEAQHECMLLTAPFWQLDDETVLYTASEVFTNISCASGNAPIHHLRALMLHLRSNTRFAALCPQVLTILSQVPSDQTTTMVLPSWTQGLNDDLRLQLRKSLSTHLFGWPNLLSLRMRLSIADLCWKLCKDPEMQAQCGQVAQGLLATISHCVLRILVRHLRAIIPVVTAPDIPFVLREVVQSLLPGSPQDLADEAQALSDALTASSFAIDPTVAALHEHCPACHAEVPLHDITRATCPNGHAWARCTITSFILSTSNVRTCIGCSRKALLPFAASDESQLPVAAQSWIVRDLLEAVQRCLFCGNSFVEIV